MRKFVNKKRQKRKYTKKSEAASSYSSAKTVYGMIPVIIMLIAFMSTVVISTPLRDSLTSIRFTFELPQFSLSNPLSFFETAWRDIVQVGVVIGTIGGIVGVTISRGLIALTENIRYGASFMSNFFILWGYGVWNSWFFVIKEFLFGMQLISQGMTFILTECDLALRFCIQMIINTTIAVGLFISRVTLAVTTTTIQFSLLLIHYLIIVAQVLFHFVTFVITVIGKTLTSTATVINTFFIRVFTAIVHIIEIPFKTLYAFWLLMKPYVDIFGKHVKMSGGDFSNMVTSLGKVSSIIGISK